VEYANITLTVKVFLFQNPQTVFSPLDCDEEEVHTPEEASQPSTSRDLKFILNVTSAEPHKVMQKKLLDLFRGQELLQNKAELLFSSIK
jgi:hypothetical protein